MNLFNRTGLFLVLFILFLFFYYAHVCFFHIAIKQFEVPYIFFMLISFTHLILESSDGQIIFFSFLLEWAQNNTRYFRWIINIIPLHVLTLKESIANLCLRFCLSLGMSNTVFIYLFASDNIFPHSFIFDELYSWTYPCF